MSYQEKNSFVVLISSILIYGVYYFIVSRMYFEGRFEGAEGLSLLGKSVLGLMLGGIVVIIIISILAAILHAMITGEENPSQIVDERDKMIELRALRVAYYVFGGGFVLSMVALALGWEVFLVFNLILLGCFVAGIAEALTQIILYRRGF